MTQQRTDQPSNVATEEPERPADKHITTSDSPPPESPSAGTEPAAGASADQADQSSDATPPSDDNQDQPPKRKRTRHRDRSAERRLKKLGAQLSEAERRDAANETRIAELEETVAALTKGETPAKEPQLADFDSPQEYAKEYAKWEAGQAPATPKPRKPVRTSDVTPPPAAPDQEILDFQQRGKEKLGDEFVEALQEQGTAVNQQMGEFMLDSDHGPEIYVHLANNQEEARKIYDSGPDRASKALKALEARAVKGDLDVGEGEMVVEDPPDPGPSDTDPGKPPAGNSRKQSKAPAPPSDTREGGTANLEPDPENESMDDYAARRAKEEARRAGRIV